MIRHHTPSSLDIRHAASTADDEARDPTVAATGRDPKELGGMATPPDGTPHGETVKVATTPLPDHGNVSHDDFSTIDAIRAWRPNR